MPRPSLIRAAVARPVPALMDRMGVTPRVFLLRAGFRADPAEWDGAAVRQTQIETLLEQAAAATGDRLFGARVGPLALDGYAPLSQALRAGGRLGAVLANAIAVAVPSVRQGVRIELAVRGAEVTYAEHPEDRTRTHLRQLSIASISMILHAIRVHLGGEWSPTLLRLPHVDPRERRALEDLLRAPVADEPDADPQIVMRRADLIRQVPPVPALMVASSPGPMHEDDLSVVTARIVRGMVECGDVALTAAAATLGVSARTLQARLETGHQTFHDLVEVIRAEVAFDLVREGRIGLTDLAFLLGYSDAANFTRAFRRWHGCPPSAVRADALRTAARPR